ncbi:uncharacterized protein LOC144102313 [Amblyomma americanum]
MAAVTSALGSSEGVRSAFCVLSAGCKRSQPDRLSRERRVPTSRQRLNASSLGRDDLLAACLATQHKRSAEATASAATVRVTSLSSLAGTSVSSLFGDPVLLTPVTAPALGTHGIVPQLQSAPSRKIPSSRLEGCLQEAIPELLRAQISTLRRQLRGIPASRLHC